jgi:hypothetical protein
MRTPIVCAAAMAALITTVAPATSQELVGFAALPADTFAPGPTSGQFITPANGVTPPFVGRQPVQGISSILPLPGGGFVMMSDNGFGAKPNSPDYVLRMYRIDPAFKTARGGAGTIGVGGSISLRDPQHRTGFPIVADAVLYPGSGIAVDPAIREHRLLTGGDFDIESVRRAPDGSYWFGEEFGPFLLHTDGSGRLLEAPYPLPGVKSPQHPQLGSDPPNLPSSRGFEGMAITPDGQTLYPMLEGALTNDPDQQRLRIYEFDLRALRYTGHQFWYRMDSAAHAIGDFTAVTERLFLVIERDGLQGSAAAFKKIFVVDLDEVDEAGYLIKREVVDLLNPRDPGHLGGQGPTFRFPFVTIESVLPFNRRTIGVLNDNNYPFSAGRTPGSPDPNEFIVIRLDQPLVETHGKKDGRKDR